MADDQENLLAINFFIDLSDMVLKEVVKEGTVLLVKNLHWRGFDSHSNIQSGYNIDCTHYITKPKGPEAEKFYRLEKYSYIAKCKSKIKVS